MCDLKQIAYIICALVPFIVKEQSSKDLLSLVIVRDKHGEVPIKCLALWLAYSKCSISVRCYHGFDRAPPGSPGGDRGTRDAVFTLEGLAGFEGLSERRMLTVNRRRCLLPGMGSAAGKVTVSWRQRRHQVGQQVRGSSWKSCSLHSVRKDHQASENKGRKSLSD